MTPAGKKADIEVLGKQRLRRDYYYPKKPNPTGLSPAQRLLEKQRLTQQNNLGVNAMKKQLRDME